MSWRDVALQVGSDQLPLIQLILDEIPHGAGQLFRILTFFATGSFPIRLFAAAAKSAPMQARVQRDLIAPDLKPFLRIVGNEWDNGPFDQATSCLVREEFLTQPIGDQSRFIVDSELRDRTLNGLGPDLRLKLAGWTLLLVSMAVLEDPQVVTLKQLNRYSRMAHTAMALFETTTTTGIEFEFLNESYVRLGRVCEVRAKELYDTPSSGSGIGATYWDAKFNLAVIRTSHLDKWKEVKGGINKAISEGLPNEPTLAKCIKALLAVIKDWALIKNGGDPELQNLQELASIVFNAGKSQCSHVVEI